MRGGYPTDSTPWQSEKPLPRHDPPPPLVGLLGVHGGGAAGVNLALPLAAFICGGRVQRPKESVDQHTV
jgi:hypothetical protein